MAGLDWLIASDMRSTKVVGVDNGMPELFSVHVIPSSVDFKTRGDDELQVWLRAHHCSPSQVAAYSTSGLLGCRTMSVTNGYLTESITCVQFEPPSVERQPPLFVPATRS